METNSQIRGLSSAHISPAHIDIYSGSGFIKVSKNRCSGSLQRKGGGIRGSIKGFSRASRRRLLQTIAKTIKNNIPLFVTLTYPDIFPDDINICKKHLDTFGKRLLRKYPKSGLIWRIEIKIRKSGLINAGNAAPHFHLLLWGVKRGEMIKFISKAWFDIVNSGDPKHLEAGTQVMQIDSWRGVMSYSSKYIAKEEEELSENIGRHWGMIGKKNIPWGELFSFRITQKNAYLLFRCLRRYTGIRNRSRQYSVSRFVENPDYWAKLVNYDQEIEE